MRKIFLLFSGLFLFAFSGCEKEVKTTDVNLHFKALFNQEPLLMYTSDYDYVDNMKLRLQLFQFYISDVALLKANGEEELIDVELVTFKDIQTSEAAEQGVTFTIEDIPAGKYQGVRLVIGLTEELNATQPSDYIAGHPLTDHYWSWALGYVFIKIEGNADLNGQDDFSEKLTYHIGANSLAREKAFADNIELKQGVPANVYFEVDLAKVLQKGSEYIDFRTTPQDHTNDMDLARFIADNLFDALIMK